MTYISIKLLPKNKTKHRTHVSPLPQDQIEYISQRLYNNYAVLMSLGKGIQISQLKKMPIT